MRKIERQLNIELVDLSLDFLQSGLRIPNDVLMERMLRQSVILVSNVLRGRLPDE